MIDLTSLDLNTVEGRTIANYFNKQKKKKVIDDSICIQGKKYEMKDGYIILENGFSIGLSEENGQCGLYRFEDNKVVFMGFRFDSPIDLYVLDGYVCFEKEGKLYKVNVLAG